LTTQHAKRSTVFPLLADPASYRACRWDLTHAHRQRAYWIGLFRRHFPSLLEQARRVAAADGDEIDEAAKRAELAFFDWLDAVEADPARYGAGGRLDILTICHERERVLRGVGIADPYRLAKQHEDDAAMSLLPGVLDELDAMPARQRRIELIRGVFAGNIFDLGATSTEAMFRDRRVDFHETRRKLKPRPWRFDDLDAWVARLDGEPHRAAVLFVDNAGPDVVLGMIPFARDLVQRGTRVILAANSTPSLNDTTHAELVGLLQRIAAFDRAVAEALGSGMLVSLADGNGAPLIDLSRLDAGFVEAVASTEPAVDLVVLEGMGRAVESNFDARFTCECLKLAMIKDAGVAEAMGATLYDLVMRYEPA
jgi:hypothetical protein